MSFSFATPGSSRSTRAYLLSPSPAPSGSAPTRTQSLLAQISSVVEHNQRFLEGEHFRSTLPGPSSSSSSSSSTIPTPIPAPSSSTLSTSSLSSSLAASTSTSYLHRLRSGGFPPSNIPSSGMPSSSLDFSSSASARAAAAGVAYLPSANTFSFTPVKSFVSNGLEKSSNGGAFSQNGRRTPNDQWSRATFHDSSSLSASYAPEPYITVTPSSSNGFPNRPDVHSSVSSMSSLGSSISDSMSLPRRGDNHFEVNRSDFSDRASAIKKRISELLDVKTMNPSEPDPVVETLKDKYRDRGSVALDSFRRKLNHSPTPQRQPDDYSPLKYMPPEKSYRPASPSISNRASPIRSPSPHSFSSLRTSLRTRSGAESPLFASRDSDTSLRKFSPLLFEDNFSPVSRSILRD